MFGEIEERFNNYQGRPIVIWGTNVAAQISYRILQVLDLKIVAVGDNNFHKVGSIWNGVLVMSAKEITSLYPNAMIVVGVLLHDMAEEIIAQLKQINEQFIFCRFEEIEVLYETQYLKRTIKNKEIYYQIINNVEWDETFVWKRKVDKRVLSEYRYVVKNNEAYDLKKTLSNIYGIKNLVLIVRDEKIQETVQLVNQLAEYENIGHIILALENKNNLDIGGLTSLERKVFYVICDDRIDENIKLKLEKAGFIFLLKKIQAEVFDRRELDNEINLTEKVAVQCVLDYVNGKQENYNSIIYQESQSVCIVQLFNGLANQALMYLFGKYLEEETGRMVIFDDTILCLDIYDEHENARRMQKWNRYETVEKAERLVHETKNRSSFYQFKRAEIAEVFDNSIHLLSDYFDEDIWEQYLKKVRQELSFKYAQSFPLGQIFIENGIDISIIRDNLMPDEYLAVDKCYCLDAYILDKPCPKSNVMKSIFLTNKNLYCFGIWATGKAEDCFLYNRPWVRQKLSFCVELNEKRRNYIKEIKQADAVMIHIRRGDFAYLHMSAKAEYFRDSIRAMEALEEYENKKYFIFSDDLEWCIQNENILGLSEVKDKIVYVSGNTGKYSYLDLYLMSLGKAIVPTPGSSFGYVAMLVSESIEKSVDIPRYVYDLMHGSDNTPMPVIIDV